MSGIIQVTYQALLDASTQTASAQSQISDLNTTVTNAVNQFGGHWTGTAHTEFYNYYTQYNQVANDLTEWLSQLSAALKAAEDDYRTGDTNVANIWRT